jgi:hypothetical protein
VIQADGAAFAEQPVDQLDALGRHRALPSTRRTVRDSTELSRR